MTMAISPDEINTVRHFNRFFTRQIGVLREGLLHSPYSLTEARIIFELAHRPNLTASELGNELGLDAGYLSRILTKLEQQNLIEKTRSDEDGRQRLITLTTAGQDAFALLDGRSSEEVAEMLGELSNGDRLRLIEAMNTIEDILNHGFKYAEPFYLRHHETGDMGWVIYQHGLLYHREYGWDESFEALVAQICADFITNYDPAKERCWLAEMQGERVGSIFCVNAGDGVAKLRLLLVDPKARDLGLGTRLVKEGIRFARRAGYQKVTLWTNDILIAARQIYEKLGFRLVAEDPHHSFGHDLVGQTWELPL
ncbi:MAG TPA: helix-turn-helix domain-containing GNAT family N-acetyltransferase [Anaerolineae bacterium]|nr:MarR family transcriptional regulator [Anaerolineae bacterium]MCB9107049.1 MarR family transcriptional regulator [Anaerolineales bacterium]HRV92697.1 helix-turn-helix domain-containing GNAT family N-acetyltransferase [Anaerolineae bacterium]